MDKHDHLFRMVERKVSEFDAKCFQVNLTGGIDSFVTASALLDLGYRVVSYSTLIVPYSKQDMEQTVRNWHVDYLKDNYPKTFDYRGEINVSTNDHKNFVHKGNNFIYQQMLRNLAMIGFNVAEDVDVVCIGSPTSDRDSTVYNDLMVKYNELLSMTCHSFKPFTSVIAHVAKLSMVEYLNDKHPRVKFWSCEHPVASGVVYRPCGECKKCKQYKDLDAWNLHVESIYLKA